MLMNSLSGVATAVFAVFDVPVIRVQAWVTRAVRPVRTSTLFDRTTLPEATVL